jgi:hypothetical protein
MHRSLLSCRYVVSALQFDDVNTAVTNLKRCYALLTGVNL